MHFFVRIFFVRTFFHSYIFRPYIFSSVYFFVCAYFRLRRYSSTQIFVHAAFRLCHFSSTQIFVCAIFRPRNFRPRRFSPSILSLCYFSSMHSFLRTYLFFCVHERGDLFIPIRGGLRHFVREVSAMYAVGRAKITKAVRRERAPLRSRPHKKSIMISLISWANISNQV